MSPATPPGPSARNPATSRRELGFLAIAAAPAPPPLIRPGTWWTGAEQIARVAAPQCVTPSACGGGGLLNQPLALRREKPPHSPSPALPRKRGGAARRGYAALSRPLCTAVDSLSRLRGRVGRGLLKSAARSTPGETAAFPLPSPPPQAGEGAEASRGAAIHHHRAPGTAVDSLSRVRERVRRGPLPQPLALRHEKPPRSPSPALPRKREREQKRRAARPYITHTAPGTAVVSLSRVRERVGRGPLNQPLALRQEKPPRSPSPALPRKREREQKRRAARGGAADSPHSCRGISLAWREPPVFPARRAALLDAGLALQLLAV